MSLESQDALALQARSGPARLDQGGLLRPGLDLEMETERPHARIDGLAIHAYIHPERLAPERMSRIVRHHLEQLIGG